MSFGGFSWKRALGITSAKRKIAKATGIPTTKARRKRKAFFGNHCLDQRKKSAGKDSCSQCTPRLRSQLVQVNIRGRPGWGDYNINQQGNK